LEELKFGGIQRKNKLLKMGRKGRDQQLRMEFATSRRNTCVGYRECSQLHKDGRLELKDQSMFKFKIF
jgi:hypothetical protein